MVTGSLETVEFETEGKLWANNHVTQHRWCHFDLCLLTGVGVCEITAISDRFFTEKSKCGKNSTWRLTINDAAACAAAY